MLRIELENDDCGLHVMRLSGALDGLTYLDLLKAFNQSIEKEAKRIVLDMNEVDYVSSAGLRVLLQGAKALKETEGEIVLFGMNSGVKEVFSLSGFKTLFRTFSSEYDAVSTS
ncbi:MAG: STAS domain-containing protein [Desulfuromonadales bacterium]|jgi:anti-sigma B factor antagonist|nr:STAS domain-containing protein [Desulfuromonadales bacterium]MDH3869930.1 STAS domain-containing protein [Desulfuromonadales bacterium]